MSTSPRARRPRCAQARSRASCQAAEGLASFFFFFSGALRRAASWRSIRLETGDMGEGAYPRRAPGREAGAPHHVSARSRLARVASVDDRDPRAAARATLGEAHDVEPGGQPAQVVEARDLLGAGRGDLERAHAPARD